MALQPQKHINTWSRISNCLVNHFGGDVRNLLDEEKYDIIKIKQVVQEKFKKDFPYLSGHKIFNYWLHVIENNTPTKFINRQEISVAPDTHHPGFRTTWIAFSKPRRISKQPGNCGQCMEGSAAD